jgi:hypothetical protein
VAHIQTARRSNGILLGGIVVCVVVVLALSRMFASSPDAVGDLSCGPASEHGDGGSLREAVKSPASVVGASAPKETAAPALPVESERRPTNPSAMIDGVIVDERTREPIPFLDVKLVATPIEDAVRTDRDGAFHSTRALPLAHLSAVVADGGRMLKTFVRDENMRTDVPWTIELEIGPTYPLVIDSLGALDPSQWTARVIETTRNFGDAGEIDVDEHRLSMHAPLPDAADHAWRWLALRTEPILVGDVPWIRYPSVEHEPDKRYRMRIQVKSDVVGQTGLARIRATIGVQEPVIVDGLREVGVLEGRLVDANDAPVNGGTLMLLPRDPIGEGDHTPQWDVVQTHGKGEFRFELAALGHHDLLAFAPRLPVVEMPVVVARGITTLGEPVRLPRSAPAGMVDQPTLDDSHARGKRGERRETLVVHVRLPQAGRFARDWVQALPATLVRSQNASLDPSALPDAPLDLEWIVLLDSRGYSKPDILPMHVSVAAPVARIEIGQSSWRQPRPLHVEVRGDPENSPEVELSFEPGGAIVAAPYAMKVPSWEVVPGTPLRWTAWRNGFAPVFGDQNAFELTKDKRERRSTPLTARVDFAPGWGAVLWCRAGEGASPADLQRLKGLGYVSDESDRIPPMHKVLAAPPLPDVRVLADGAFAGKSDSEGVIRIALARQPLRLVLVADRWHMTRLDRVQGAGVAQRYVVWMDRDE